MKMIRNSIINSYMKIKMPNVLIDDEYDFIYDHTLLGGFISKYENGVAININELMDMKNQRIIKHFERVIYNCKNTEHRENIRNYKISYMSLIEYLILENENNTISK